MPRPSVEAERREQILVATCEVLAEVGRHSLRLSDVARRAGVSSGTVHYYFESKQDVLAAAFELNFERSLERRRELLAAEATPWETLVGVLDSYLPGPDTWTAWRVWAELWAEAMRDERLREINERLYAEWRALVVDLLSRCQDAGEVRAGDVGTQANMLISMVDGLATQVLAGSSSMTVDTMRAVLRTFLDDGLASGAGPSTAALG